MKLKHHIQAISMLHNEWDLGKKSSKAIGKTCAVIYWLQILGDMEHLVIKTSNKGNLIDIAAYTNYKSNKHLLRKRLCKCVESADI